MVVETTNSAAVRMPAKISGMRQRQLHLAQDLPAGHAPSRGRRRRARGRPVDRHVGVGDDRRHGQHDQRQLARSPARVPRNATPIASTARLGSARQMLPRLMATNEPRWMWPSHSPIGSRDDERDGHRRCRRSSASPSVRCTSVGSGGSPGIWPLRPMNLNAWTKSCTLARSGSPGQLRGPSPTGSEKPLGQTSSPSATSASATASTPAAISSVLNTLFEIAVEDRDAEALVVDQRGDRRQRDRGHGGDPQAGDDRRQRQRQLDAQQQLRGGLMPIPAAASRTSAGTSRRPVSVLRNMISSV